jgi:biotin operon repressor
MSKRVIVDGMGNGMNNNEIMEEKMERSEVIEMVKGFVSEMNGEERKEFLKELCKEVKVSFGDDGGRKSEVRKLLEENRDGISIIEIGEKLGMSNKNVSSVLSYLRKDGLRLGTRSDGRKYIEE